jgi:hypothetical protein
VTDEASAFAAYLADRQARGLPTLSINAQRALAGVQVQFARHRQAVLAATQRVSRTMQAVQPMLQQVGRQLAERQRQREIQAGFKNVATTRPVTRGREGRRTRRATARAGPSSEDGDPEPPGGWRQDDLSGAAA